MENESKFTEKIEPSNKKWWIIFCIIILINIISVIYISKQEKVDQKEHIQALLREEAGAKYIRNDFVWGIKQMPLKVFVKKDGEKYKGFKPQWPLLIDKALNEWSEKTDGLITFTRIDDKRYADIVFEWTDESKQASSAGMVYRLAGAVTPIFGNKLLTNTITIITEPLFGIKLTDEHMYHSILHEMGHSLGFAHHSSDPTSLFYPASSPETAVQNISQKDIALLLTQYQSDSPHIKHIERSYIPLEIALKDMNTVEELIKDKQYKEAHQLLEKLDNQYPNTAVLHAFLAHTYLELHMFGKLNALIDYWEPIALDTSLGMLLQGIKAHYLGRQAVAGEKLMEASRYYELASKYYHKAIDDYNLVPNNHLVSVVVPNILVKLAFERLSLTGALLKEDPATVDKGNLNE